MEPGKRSDQHATAEVFAAAFSNSAAVFASITNRLLQALEAQQWAALDPLMEQRMAAYNAFNELAARAEPELVVKFVERLLQDESRLEQARLAALSRLTSRRRRASEGAHACRGYVELSTGRGN